MYRISKENLLCIVHSKNVRTEKKRSASVGIPARLALTPFRDCMTTRLADLRRAPLLDDGC
nr:unnamed protein product [Callosobruchus analis]